MVAINYLGSGEPDANPPAGGRAPLHTPGDFSFVVLLPHAVDGEAALEKSVTADALNTWCGKLGGDSVEVYLPKFHIEQRIDLSDALQAAGMTDAFNPKLADFSGMTGDRTVFVSRAIHQTFLDVDEKGTEAAAATAVMMTRSAIMRPPTPTPVFRADHPFLFFIRENSTGSILFMGRLATPTTSG
jgi:serpin B